MGVKTQAERLDSKLPVATYVKNLARLYGSIMNQDPELLDYEVDPGFSAVASEALAILRESEQAEISLSAVEMAQRVRGSYSVPMRLEMSPWDSLPAINRIAWEYVGRYAAFAPQADSADEANSAGTFHEKAMIKLRGQ